MCLTLSYINYFSCMVSRGQLSTMEPFNVLHLTSIIQLIYFLGYLALGRWYRRCAIRYMCKHVTARVVWGHAPTPRRIDPLLEIIFKAKNSVLPGFVGKHDSDSLHVHIWVNLVVCRCQSKDTSTDNFCLRYSVCARGEKGRSQSPGSQWYSQKA